MHIIYIGAGGFIGAVSRYLISKYLNNIMPSFPLGTLAVNIAGSLIIGFVIYSITLGKNISPEMRDFITIGIIGGFTTMSTFAYESFRLLELNQLWLFILNIFFNIVLCIGAVYAGKELALLISK
ncbi:MAG TPA: fluoride efflux transporter CrcB [Ignavibacteria bacterium]|nr:fluoride efflux transporter CrcB [Ignavibacteria bacterium]